jgi:hypothetical protein
MTTAYRFDLVHTVYETEIARLTASLSLRMDATLISCPMKDCGVQYSLLGPRDAAAGEILIRKAAVVKALEQQYCPHHPPKIELD